MSEAGGKRQDVVGKKLYIPQVHAPMTFAVVRAKVLGIVIDGWS
jgi:hypothetical protein